ncbi:MAG TPA: HAD family phosphatase [bacterium]|nr:HAD family phosphatase [bacterium]
MPPVFSIVIWDMDGVLIDSERYWADEDFFFLRRAVHDWEQVDEALFVGRSIDGMYELLTNQYQLQMDYQEYCEHYDQVAKRVYMEKAALMPHAYEVLTSLKERHIQQILVSSSPHKWIEFAMDRFRLKTFFDTIISADDVGGRGKPHPDIYQYTREQLNQPISAIIAIEDSSAGVEAAHGAGLTVVGFQPEESTQDLQQADGLIQDLRPVVRIVDCGIPDR